MADKKKTEASEPDLPKRVAQLETALGALRLRLEKLLARKYPQITTPLSGSIVLRTQDLHIIVHANVRGPGLYEVAITDENGDPVGNTARTAPITFMSDGFGGYMNPSEQATIAANLMGTLAANTEYVLICRAAGSTSNVVEHKISITTGP